MRDIASGASQSATLHRSLKRSIAIPPLVADGTSAEHLRYGCTNEVTGHRKIVMAKRSKGPAVRAAKGKRGNGAQKLKQKKKK
jgi:hypothetical protein